MKHSGYQPLRIRVASVQLLAALSRRAFGLRICNSIYNDINMSLYALFDWREAAAFALAATALLGSPGPGITALLAVGRAGGMRAGLPFYASLQIGLAIACAISATGIIALLALIPFGEVALSILATAYLMWLAWRIASAPVPANRAPMATSAFLLGIANPKAYLAFASLMGSFRLIPIAGVDAAAKWILCVAVMMIVDLAWLWVGALVHHLPLRPRAERAANVAMGCLILAACAAALL